VHARDLALRRRIFESFAATGEPPDLQGEDLTALAEQHVIVLDGDRIVMAHPFAAHTGGARVDADGRTWWGNCAWDALGIVHALRLEDATITANAFTLPRDDAAFHVLVPAAHWWDDIAFT
jgi:hypothetical protein